jgi:branched-subunit amino acid aminotransferase/4-amino-4-deoxychorismate lyase
MVSMDAFVEAHLARNAALEASDNPFARGIAWVQGECMPIHEARIPLLDQGFLHADLTYDVPAIWNGRFFRLDDHLDRLWQSMAKVRLNCPLDRATLRSTLVDMARTSGIRDAYVMIIVTRGLRFVRQLAVEGTLDTAVGNLYMYIVPYVWVMPLQMQRRGGSAIVTRTVRRIPPGAIDPTVKNFQWGDFIRGVFEANDRGAVYPLLPDGDGNLTEGSGFNVVVVKHGAMRSPARGVLEGVTRRTVQELAHTRGLKFTLEDVPVADLYHCDELFLVTTAGGVMPITTLDGQPVGNGQVGPVTAGIWSAYWAAHEDDAYSFSIDA